MKLAAIDIGSNSIHLVIVRAESGQHLEIIDREKEMVRLGSGTLRAHKLSKQTIERAITTLRRFKQMAEANRVRSDHSDGDSRRARISQRRRVY